MSYPSRYFRCNYAPDCSGRGVEDENGFRETKSHHGCEQDAKAQEKKDFHEELKSKMTKYADPIRVYEEVAKEYVIIRTPKISNFMFNAAGKYFIPGFIR